MDTAESPVLPVVKRRRTPGSLSGKQEAYAQSYARQGNCVKAYMDAGYLGSADGIPPKSLANRAYAIIRNPSVKQRIAQIREESENRRADRAELTRDWIVTELQEVHARSKAAGGNDAVGVRALELLGKHLGMFSETVTIDLGQLREYTESEALEARRLAALRLEDSNTPATGLPQPGQCEHTMPADIPGNARVLPDSDESTPPLPPNGPGVNSRPSPEPTQ